MQELPKEYIEQFKKQFPNAFFLSYDTAALTHFLQEKDFMDAGEKVEKLEKPGEGNMNFVVRAITNQRSFIVKQARPWVEKYPQIHAPVNRNKAETAYYKVIKSNSLLESFSPLLLFSDKKHFIAIYSDLGNSRDFTHLYEPEQIFLDKPLNKLLAYLSELHALEIKDFPENKAMRELNHEHIFKYPFVQDNGFDLNGIQDGLEEVALKYKTDLAVKEKTTYLGDLYLSKGKSLIHGDFYPGSWVANKTGIKVIDPEFSFLGYAEFDIGVLIAHLYLVGQGVDTIQHVLNHYIKPTYFDIKLVAGFAGTEIMRRLLGVAQLPLPFSLEKKEEILVKASNWLLNDEIVLE